MSEWNIKPTVEETLRFIRKLEKLSSDGTKLIVMRNFAEKVLAYAERSSTVPATLLSQCTTDEERAYMRGFRDGLKGGLRVAEQILDRQLPQPIIIQRGPSSAEENKG